MQASSVLTGVCQPGSDRAALLSLLSQTAGSMQLLHYFAACGKQATSPWFNPALMNRSLLGRGR